MATQGKRGKGVAMEIGYRPSGKMVACIRKGTFKSTQKKRRCLKAALLHQVKRARVHPVKRHNPQGLLPPLPSLTQREFSTHSAVLNDSTDGESDVEDDSLEDIEIPPQEARRKTAAVDNTPREPYRLRQGGKVKDASEESPALYGEGSSAPHHMWKGPDYNFFLWKSTNSRARASDIVAEPRPSLATDNSAQASLSPPLATIEGDSQVMTSSEMTSSEMTYLRLLREKTRQLVVSQRCWRGWGSGGVLGKRMRVWGREGERSQQEKPGQPRKIVEVARWQKKTICSAHMRSTKVAPKGLVIALDHNEFKLRHHGDPPDPSHGTFQMTPSTVPASVSVNQNSITENTALASHPLSTPPALHLEPTSLDPGCPVTPPSTDLGTSVLSLTLTPCTSASVACVAPAPTVLHPHTGGPEATPTTPGAVESWECVEEVETEVELVSTGGGGGGGSLHVWE
eukprot:Em0074g18a